MTSPGTPSRAARGYICLPLPQGPPGQVRSAETRRQLSRGGHGARIRRRSSYCYCEEEEEVHRTRCCVTDRVQQILAGCHEGMGRQVFPRDGHHRPTHARILRHHLAKLRITECVSESLTESESESA